MQDGSKFITGLKEAWNTLGKAKECQRNGNFDEVIDEVIVSKKYAKKHFINDLYFHFCSMLHWHYFIVRRDLSEGRKIEKELSLAKDLLSAESKAKEAYVRLISRIQGSRKINKVLRESLESNCSELESLLNFNNPNISIYIFPLLIHNAYLKEDYQAVIHLAEGAINFFNKYNENKVQHFKALLIPALIISKDFNRANQVIQSSKIVRLGHRFNYSVFLYFETINLIHSEQYQKAFETLNKIDENDSINPTLIEQWRIVRGFMHILCNAGVVNEGKRFRLGKLLNEIPVFEKDKYGNYINIIILKLIIGIQENIGKLIDDLEAIEKLYFRYCIAGTREKLFIKMLLKIPVHRFNYNRVINATKKELEALRAMPLNPQSIDIIPYPTLWEIVLGSIKKA